MSTFLVTIDDEFGMDASDVRAELEGWSSGKDWRLNPAVEQIEVIHSEADGRGREVVGLSYRVVDAA